MPSAPRESGPNRRCPPSPDTVEDERAHSSILRRPPPVPRTVGFVNREVGLRGDARQARPHEVGNEDVFIAEIVLRASTEALIESQRLCPDLRDIDEHLRGADPGCVEQV